MRRAGELSRLDVLMGRRSKGERRQVMTRVPPLTGQLIRREVEALGCHYSDFIAYTLCQHAGVPMEIPMGDVDHHPDPREAPGDRVEFMSRVPVAAADVVTEGAQRMGVSIADYIGKVLCDQFEVPFEPRVKKKALKAWARGRRAVADDRLTGSGQCPENDEGPVAPGPSRMLHRVAPRFREAMRTTHVGEEVLCCPRTSGATVVTVRQLHAARRLLRRWRVVVRWEHALPSRWRRAANPGRGPGTRRLAQELSCPS